MKCLFKSLIEKEKMIFQVNEIYVWLYKTQIATTDEESRRGNGDGELLSLSP